MAQVLGPDNLPDLVIATTTTITMGTTYLGKETRITIGGQQYLYSSLITLNFAVTGINGLDTGAIALNSLYYIYSVQTSGVPGLVASLAAPGTGPTGFTAWKEVGRCRTLLTAATLATITNRLGGTSLNPSDAAWASFSPIVTDNLGAAIFNVGVIINSFKKRSVSNLDVQFAASQSSAGTIGSGIYRFYLPGNTFSTTTLNADSTVLKLVADFNIASRVGEAKGNSVAAGANDGFMASYSSVYMALVVGNATNILAEASASFIPANAALQYVYTASIPIAEYVGLYT